jgi:hypothetical protein
LGARLTEAGPHLVRASRRRVPVVNTFELTDDELRLLQNALHSYLDDFGHEEADILRDVKALIAKLQQSQ